MKRAVPHLTTDADAEAVLAGDLSDLDFAAFQPARLEFEN